MKDQTAEADHFHVGFHKEIVVRHCLIMAQLFKFFLSAASIIINYVER